jgi:hypothetical protein
VQWEWGPVRKIQGTSLQADAQAILFRRVVQLSYPWVIPLNGSADDEIPKQDHAPMQTLEGSRIYSSFGG